MTRSSPREKNGLELDTGAFSGTGDLTSSNKNIATRICCLYTSFHSAIHQQANTFKIRLQNWFK